MEKCYNCIYRKSIPGDAHSMCMNLYAEVERNSHGVKNGWCFWPINFDPIWIESCDGHLTEEEYNARLEEESRTKTNPREPHSG